MKLKDSWSKAIDWLGNHKPVAIPTVTPSLNEDGLISSEEPRDVTDFQDGQGVSVNAIEPAEKNQSIEKLQAGFNNLVGQLEGINEHLDKQVTQHQELMNRIDQLPKLMENFPSVVENQKQLIEQLVEQVKGSELKQQQFVETIEKIPAETAKQTDALEKIDHQLAAAADADVQTLENFNKFNEVLDKLNLNTAGQTDSILQMSKTFAASDRYLKYLMSRQNKRFFWIFTTSVVVCLVVILILAGIIIFLRQ